MPSRLLRRLTAAMLLVLLPACYSWRPITGSPQQLLSEEQPEAVRVTSTGGAMFILQNPSMTVDSIVGSTEFGPVRMAARDFPLLEVHRFDLFKTLAVATLNVAAVVAIGCLFAQVQPHYAPC